MCQRAAEKIQHRRIPGLCFIGDHCFSDRSRGIFCFVLLGNLIAKAVRAVTQKRRAADLNKLTAIAAGIGGAVPILRYILGLFRMIFIGNYAGLMGYTLSVGWGILYIALLCTTILTNMRGFAIRRR